MSERQPNERLIFWPGIPEVVGVSEEIRVEIDRNRQGEWERKLKAFREKLARHLDKALLLSIEVLRESGTMLSQKELLSLANLKSDKPLDDTPFKLALSAAVKEELLTRGGPHKNSKGYGLPEWDWKNPV